MSILAKTASILSVSSMILLTAAPAFAQSITAKQATTAAVQKRQALDQKIAAGKDKLATREAALKAKLEKFKDQRKAKVAERISANLTTINQNQTRLMQSHLTTMLTILEKFGRRTSGTSAAILTARSTIASASAAVSAQAQKDYTLAVSSESKIKTDAKAQREKLHTELFELKKLVRDAKKAVSDAIRTAKSGGVVKDNKEAEDGTQ